MTNQAHRMKRTATRPAAVAPSESAPEAAALVFMSFKQELAREGWQLYANSVQSFELLCAGCS